MKRVVYITGCLGFIGIHVTRACLDQGWYVIGVDKMTYASNEWALEGFQSNPRFQWIQKDINDLDRLVDCDYIINLAAETHVDNSIMSSDVFLQSNVNGVHHLLEMIKTLPAYKRPVFVQFSTDEVYGDIVEGSHQETDLLCPSNPYSASKAAADMLILAWARTYGIRYNILRPTNNYGVGQYVEKLIPKSIKYLELGRKIDVHDRGEPVRTWLHADDTAQALITVIKKGEINEIYNISGNIELPNRETIKKILSLYFAQDMSHCWLDFITEGHRVGQDVRYSINDDKLKSLGWKAGADFDQELAVIVDHYRNKFVW